MQEEECRKVRLTEAAQLMDVSIRAVYNRINKYGWKHEKDFENNAWVWIPEKFIKAVSEQNSSQDQELDTKLHKENAQLSLNLQRSPYEESMMHVEGMRSRYEQEQVQLREEIRLLREELRVAETQCARMEGEVRRGEEMERTITALRETIDAQKMANDALNNERFVITQQLQRYRSERTESASPSGKPFWKFWG